MDWNDSYNTLIANNKMNEPVPGVVVPSIEKIPIKHIENEMEVLNSIENGTVDITLKNVRAYNFIDIFTNNSPVEPIVELKNAYQVIYYSHFSPIWGMHPSEPCKVYNDTSCEITTTNTTTTDSTPLGTSAIDTLSIFFFTTISIVVVYSRSKKLD